MKRRNTFKTKERFTRIVLRINTVLSSIWNAGMLEAHSYIWSTRRTWLNSASEKERKTVFKRSAIAGNWRTNFQKAPNGSDFTQLSWLLGIHLVASCFCSQHPLEETPILQTGNRLIFTNRLLHLYHNRALTPGFSSARLVPWYQGDDPCPDGKQSNLFNH